jgi:hypothetical protein
MTTRKVGELVLDFDVYPRMSVDSQHIGYMHVALDAGVKLPPVVVCAKTLRVADGFHRCRLYLGVYGPEHPVDVIERKYPNDAALFADAMRMNANHGRTLSSHDRVHCALLAEKLALTLDITASALGMTVEKLTTLRADRTATLTIAGKARGPMIPLKQTIRHMAGQTLTHEQAKANERLSGMNQLFYVNQLTMLLKADLIDLENEDLMAALYELGGLIRKLKAAA